MENAAAPRHLCRSNCAVGFSHDDTGEASVPMRLIKLLRRPNRRRWLRRCQEDYSLPFSYMNCELVVLINLLAINNCAGRQIKTPLRHI